MTAPVFIGIDPGYDRLGWAVGAMVGSNLSVRAFNTITSTAKTDIFSRYQDILRGLQAIIDEHHPTELAIETLFFSSNKTTAMRVSETRGIIIGHCLLAGLNVFEYNPTQVKQIATGSGRADKTMMSKMIALQTKLELHDTLDDAIDAVAVLLTHCLLRKTKII